MSNFYKKGPSDVPKTITKASSSFKRHVFLAMLALGSFIIVYIGLMLWFGYHAYILFDAAVNKGISPFYSIIAGICIGMLSIFMFKSLFIFKSKREGQDRELKREAEPELFDYIHKLADEVGAPRPYKIILTARVNASVFYDLNIFNLLIPSKKNLEIGLGVVNVLNIGELKAVLAHEFGHFAQRSMLLGRYVYTAQQIAERVVNKRDALDNVIRVISSIDIRIAWIGWIISILVWAIRALIEVLFSVVVYAERALSREMEFQADKVAVSVTGSDALIHALHKLRAADEGYRAGIDTVNTLLNQKKAAPDLFALQSNYIKKTRWIMDDPSFGMSPERENRSGRARVFKSRLVNPPEMWSTHPADLDREENAKEHYLYAEIDERSAWDLFKDAEKLRKQVTAELIATAEMETELISVEESITAMNEADYNWTFLNPRYKGVYLSRFSFVNFQTSDEIYADAATLSTNSSVSRLYPDELKDLLEKHKEVNEEIHQLTIVQHEVLTAEKRIIMHRGDQIKRRQIPSIIKTLKKEEAELRKSLMDHDVLCRQTAYKIALEKNPPVAEYLKSISRLVHYSEHAIRDIDDIVGKLHNTLAVVTADGRVTDAEMANLLQDCRSMNKALEPVYEQCNEIVVPPSIQKKIGTEYKNLFEEYKLGDANRENINDWVSNLQSWVNLAQHALYKLRNTSLEHLLDTEEQLLEAHRNNSAVSIEIGAVSTLDSYNLLMPGSERKIQYKLGLWDRFIAGVGIVPTTAKFLASAGLVMIAIWAGNVDDRYSDGYYDYYDDDYYYGDEESVNFHLYNGLGIAVTVEVDNREYTLPAYSEKSIMLSLDEDYMIRTYTTDEELIEQLTASLTEWGDDYIYNVANAAYFIEYDIQYVGENGEGMVSEPNNDNIGNPSVFSTDANYILEDPPEYIQTHAMLSSVVTTKRALLSLGEMLPYEYPEIGEPDAATKKMIKNHIKYDPVDDANLIYWLALSASFDPNGDLARDRLRSAPNEVIFVRHLQDYLTGDARKEVLAEYAQLARENPNDADLFYLNTRVMENETRQNQLFISGSNRWPDHGWLCYAGGYVLANQENWSLAAERLAVVYRNLPALKSTVVSDFKRCVNMLDAADATSYKRLLSRNTEVEELESLENGFFKNEAGRFDNVYYYLSQGDIQEAVNHAKTFAMSDYRAFDWYVAASKGVTDNYENKVLDYRPDRTIHMNNVSMALALLAKHDRDYAEVLDIFGRAKGFDEKGIETVKSFIQAVKNGQISLAEAAINRCTDFRQKMHLRLVGAIMTGGDCPEKWVDYSKRMLFVTERPYMQ